MQKFRIISINIKIKHKFKVTVGHGAGFQLYHVNAKGIKAVDDPVKRALLMGKHDHKAGAVSTGVDLQIFADADKAGEIVAHILHTALEALEIIQPNTCFAAESSHIFPAGVCYHFGSNCSVCTRSHLNTAEL